MPFTADYLYDMVTVIDDDDLKEWGMYSEETLLEKYYKNAETVKSASPPINNDDAVESYPEVDDYLEKKEKLGSDFPILGK